MVNGRGGWDGAERELAFVTMAIRTTISRLLRGDEVRPQLVARLLARVAGELGAAAALADGTEVEAVLDELADAMRRAGGDCQGAAWFTTGPTAGNA